MSYTVYVTREDGHWQASVEGLPGGHTYARTLTALDRDVREVIVLMADLPDDAMSGLDISYRYDVADTAVFEGADVGHRRADLAAAEHRLADDTYATVTRLLDAGYSVRDVAALVGLTPGRVSQLARRSPSAA